MNSLLYITLFSIVAFAIAGPMVVTPDSISGTDGMNQGNSVAIKNTVANGDTLNSVSFVITPSASTITISYPNSAAKATVGSIQYNAIGYGSFFFVGPAGTYSLLVTVTYKKGSALLFSTYNDTIILNINIDGPPPTGRREIAASDDETMVLGRTADLTINPLSYGIDDGTPTWVGVYITAGTTALVNVSFTAFPSDSTVTIGYPLTGNYLGPVAANHEKDSSMQLTGSLGSYSVNVTVKYRKGISSTWYYLSQVAVLNINGGSTTAGRFAAMAKTLGFDASNVNVQALVAISAGVAAFAGVAVVGVALFIRRNRNSSVPTTITTTLVA